MNSIFTTLFTACTFFSLHCFSQNYNPFVYDNTSLFQFADKIEAFQEEAGSMIYDYRGYGMPLIQAWDLYWMGGTCNPHNIATWAGARYTKGFMPHSPANSYFFFNINDEPIMFFPLKELGEKWTMYTYTNGNYIEATISDKEQLSFLELTDSVKTISLQLKDASGTALVDPVNSVVYQLSKNYGLLQLTRFLNFPTATAIGTLIGLTTPKKGLQLITSRDIFNFNIGDEFHYDSLYENSYTHQRVSIKTIKVISGIYRSANTDTVIYTTEQYKENHTLHTETLEEAHNYVTETVKEKYTLGRKQLYPAQANLGIETFLNNAPYYLTLFAGDNNRSLWSTNGEWFIPVYNQANCYGEVLYDPVHTYEYLEGCGLFIDKRHLWSGVSAYKHLVYFKKGSHQWGDALTITSSASEKENTNALLFPNPLKQGEQLHYDLGSFNVAEVLIYNSTGNKVLKPSFNASTIDVASFPSGLYVIQFLNNKNKFVSNKFIIK